MKREVENRLINLNSYYFFLLNNKFKSYKSFQKEVKTDEKLPLLSVTCSLLIISKGWSERNPYLHNVLRKYLW